MALHNWPFALVQQCCCSSVRGKKGHCRIQLDFPFVREKCGNEIKAIKIKHHLFFNTVTHLRDWRVNNVGTIEKGRQFVNDGTVL